MLSRWIKNRIIVVDREGDNNMPSIDEQKMGVLLGIRARKLGIYSIVLIVLFAWTVIGGIIGIFCCIIGYRSAKIAKALAPDSPVVQSAYMINNILRWVFLIVPFITSVISLVIYGILLLLGVATL